MPLLDLFISGISAGVKAAGAKYQGEVKGAIYDTQALVDDRQGELETYKADYDVERQRDKTRRVIAAQQNIYLGQGFQLSGTPLDVAYDTRNESEKDVYAIRFAARVKSENYKAEANNRRLMADDARYAGKLGAQTAYLDFAGKVAAEGAKIAGAFATGGASLAFDTAIYGGKGDR